MKNVITVLVLLFFVNNIYSQIEPIDVADLTIKVGGVNNKELYYGFAKGDIIVFNYEEQKGKFLKEIEIVELPSNSKFMDFKSVSITDKEIKVNKTAVYKFVFKNTNLANRICKIRIQRIPKTNEQIEFNTEWKWKSLYDTSYISYTIDSLTGYDTTYLSKTKKVFDRSDTIVTELLNKYETVHSSLNLSHSQYAYINVNLPINKYIPNNYNPYESLEVISWSYWLGVGQQSQQQYKNVNNNIEKGISAIGSLTGYGALANLALTGVSLFTPSNIGDNVGYKFYYSLNNQTYTFNSGNGISASGRYTNLKQGGFSIELYNDNFKDGINVNVKIVCVQVQKKWKDIEYKEMISTPKYKTLYKKKMKIKEHKIRVNAY